MKRYQISIIGGGDVGKTTADVDSVRPLTWREVAAAVESLGLTPDWVGVTAYELRPDGFEDQDTSQESSCEYWPIRDEVIDQEVDFAAPLP